MKCEEYREALASLPDESFAGGAEHSGRCADCAAFRDDIRSLDRMIARALALDVPEPRLPGLAPVEGTSGVFRFPFRRTSGPVWLGLAATIAIAAVLGVRMLAIHPGQPALAAEILAHLELEPDALRVTSTAVSSQWLDTVVGTRAVMDSSAGLVTYATNCVVNGHTVPHLVIQGEHGPVTLLLLAEEKIDAAIPIEGEGIRGVILPVGDGSIAIIGGRDEPLERIQERIIDSVQWKT